MHTTLENLGHWTLAKGLHIVLVVIFTIITTRLIKWIAGRISKQLTKGDERDATPGSQRQRSKRQRWASVKADELPHRVPVGELIHAAVDLVERDSRRHERLDRQPARLP